MKKVNFEELKREERFSLRKLNVGVASVLLGITVFGVNAEKNKVLVYADIVDNDEGNDLPDVDTDEVETPVDGSVNTTDESAVEVQTLSANTSDKTSSDQTDATNSVADSTADLTKSDSQTDKTAAEEQKQDKSKEQAEAEKLAALPDTTQTVTKVTDPMMEDYASKSGKGTWVDQTIAKGMFDYPSNAEKTIFGDLFKKGIIKENPDQYFFAGYVDNTEDYHRIIIFARGQDAKDQNLYAYIVHTFSNNVQLETLAPDQEAKISYSGFAGIGGSTYDLIIHNYKGESFSVGYKDYKDRATGENGLTPIFDQGILNPRYEGLNVRQIDALNYHDHIGRWASVIPQETKTSIRYVDQETGEDIAKPLEISGYGYQGYKINGDAPEIEGYELVSSPETLGLSYQDGVIASYKIGGTYTQYITDDIYVEQTVLDAHGTVRATAYYKGQPLENYGSQILGHGLDNNKMTFSVGGKDYTYSNLVNYVDNSMVYYYHKVGQAEKSQLNIHYIDVSSDHEHTEYAPVDGIAAVDPATGNQISDLTYTGDMGESYDFSSAAIAPEGYLVVGTSNLVGTFSTDHDAYVYIKIDRSKAKDTVSALTNLNDAQKKTALAQVEQANNSAELDHAVSDATRLDNGMIQLQKAAADLVDNTNYKYASDKYKANASADNSKADAILNQGQDASVGYVLDLIGMINNDKRALDGYNNLVKAHSDISKLTNINKWQNSDAKQAISTATDYAALQAVVIKMQKLDQGMLDLKNQLDLVKDLSQTVNYKCALSDLQMMFDASVDAAKADLEQAIDLVQVNELQQAITDAQAKLNGDANLANAQKQVFAMSDLNKAQVSHISTDLTQATSYDALEQMVEDAQALNGDMAGLKQTLNQAEIAQGTQNYADSDAQIRADFDQVILNAQDKLVLNILDSEVTSAKQAILDAQAKLNGIQKLKEAKDGAIEAVSDLANMIQEQKQASIDQISAAQTLSQATAAWATAQSLNTELGKLTKAIDSVIATQKLVSYLEADSDKKTSLDQALTAANSVRVGMDVSAVTDALNLVLNAQADLNGVTNLANKKAEVNQVIEQLTSLNQAQKQEFKNQVVAVDKSSNLAAISTQASDLNAEMGKLIKAVADAEASYATVNYNEADQDKQAALTKAVEAGKIATDFEKGQAIDDAGINDLIASIVAEQTGLNGQSNLDQAKADASQYLAGLTNLTTDQSQTMQAKINQAQARAIINDLQDQATSLNEALGNLKQAINSAKDAQETVNYLEADQAKKKALGQALTNAEVMVASSDIQAINQASQVLQLAQSALNGDTNLAQAKTKASQEIADLDNLSTDQKQYAQAQIKDAKSVKDINGISQAASELNTNVGDLKQAISDAEKAKKSSNYKEATAEKKSAFDESLNQAAIIQDSNDVAEVVKATKNLQAAQSGLDGAEVLTKEKADSSQKISQLTDLNDKQKQAIEDAIAKADSSANIIKINQAADVLNQAMSNLRDAINDVETSRDTIAYKEADKDKQVALDTKVAIAEQEVSVVKDLSVVEELSKAISDAKTALNGESNLADAKKDAVSEIEDLANLSDSQRQHVKDVVNGSTSRDEAIKASEEASALNDAISNLDNVIKAAESNHDTISYKEADTDKQTDLDSKIAKAKEQLSTVNDLSVVEELAKLISDAKTALNGESNLNDAKNNATSEIEELTNLSDSQKQHAKDLVEESISRDAAIKASDDAKALNESIANLDDVIKQAESTHNSISYKEADSEKQTDLDSKIADAKTGLSTTNDVATIEELAKKITEAQTALNGESNLTDAKNNAISSINGLIDLSDSQKQHATDLINNSDSRSNVTTVVEDATKLAESIENLQEVIKTAEDSHNTISYKEADTDKQTALDEKIASVKSESTITNDLSVIESLAKSITEAQAALNGESSLAEAKKQAANDIDSLSNLSDSQKQYAKDLVDSSTSRDAIIKAKEATDSLAAALAQLADTIETAEASHTTTSYTEADEAMQVALDEKLETAKQEMTITNELLVVQDLTQATIDAQKALNGQSNLDQAKKEAISAIDSLTNLSDSQKKHSQSMVDQAVSRADVAKAKGDAISLDDAAGKATEAIDFANETIETENYTMADFDRQAEVDQALNKAKSIGFSGINAVEINNAVQDLMTALKKLNGNINASRAQADTISISVDDAIDEKVTTEVSHIKLVNSKGTNRTLTRNAYTYNSKGERIFIFKKMKKGALVKTYGKKVKLKDGKEYYRIGKDRYIKAINFKSLIAKKKK